MFLYTSRIIFAFAALINLNYVIVLILSSVGLFLFVLALFYGYFVKRLNKEALKRYIEKYRHLMSPDENSKIDELCKKYL